MKGPPEGQAGGGKRFSGEGKGDRLFHPLLLPGNDIVHRPVIIGNEKIVTIKILTDLLNFLQGEARNAGHGPLRESSLSPEKSSNRFRDEESFFERDRFGRSQGGINPHAVFCKNLGYPSR